VVNVILEIVRRIRNVSISDDRREYRVPWFESPDGVIAVVCYDEMLGSLFKKFYFQKVFVEKFQFPETNSPTTNVSNEYHITNTRF